MIVLDPGHEYDLRTLDAPHSAIWQRLRFVKREGEKYPGNKGSYPGTTSQEVLRALINRAHYVNAQAPCWQTKLGISLMGIVVWLFEHRAAKRHGRKAPGFHHAIYGYTCFRCGHVGCREESHFR